MTTTEQTNPVGELIADMIADGIARFGSVDAFMAALEAAQR